MNGEVIDVPNQHNIIIVDDFLSTRQCEIRDKRILELKARQKEYEKEEE